MIKRKEFKCLWCKRPVEGILDFTKKYRCRCNYCADVFYMDAEEENKKE